MLWKLPAMKKLLKHTKAKRVSFAMCTYGAPTIKPTVSLARMVKLAWLHACVMMCNLTRKLAKGLVYPAQHPQAAQAHEHALGSLCPGTEDTQHLYRKDPLIPHMRRKQKPEMVKKKKDKHGRVRIATNQHSVMLHSCMHACMHAHFLKQPSVVGKI